MGSESGSVGVGWGQSESIGTDWLWPINASWVQLGTVDIGQSGLIKTIWDQLEPIGWG